MTDTDDDLGYLHVVSCRFGGGDDQLAAWNAWYDQVHVPAMLAVPGISAVSRYAELGSDQSFLATYEIDSPAVFDHPKYVEARGWGTWAPNMDAWTIALFKRDRPDRKFGSDAATS